MESGAAGVPGRALGGAAHLGRPARRQVCLQLLNALAKAAAGPGARGVSGAGGRGRGGAGGSAVRAAAATSPGAAAAALEPGAAPAPRPCVCACACVRGRIQPGEGAGGVSLRKGLRREPGAGAGQGGRTDRRPRPLTHAAPRPPPGRRAPPRQRRGDGEAGVAVSARTRSLADTHTHAGHATDTRQALSPGRAPRTLAPALTLTRAQALQPPPPEAALGPDPGWAGGK